MFEGRDVDTLWGTTVGRYTRTSGLIRRRDRDMIIWRGWGILAFLGIGLSVGLTAIMSALSGTNMDGATWQGIPGFLLGGIVVFFLGTYLNMTRPTQKFSEARALSYGLLAPALDGTSVPLPLEEQPPLNQEEQVLLRHLRNRHTLFFIPMQWWGIALPMMGVAITLAASNN